MFSIERNYDGFKDVFSQVDQHEIDNITVANADGVFIKVQCRCKDFFGIMENELIGQNAYQLVKRGVFDISATTEVMKFKREVSLVQRTKGDRLLLVKSYPLFDIDNNIVEIINFSKDITTPEKMREIIYQNNELLAEYYRRQKKNKCNFIAKSENMQHMLEMIEAVLNLDTSILLLGETGSSKSYIAKYIHEHSNRKSEPFVIVNCGAIPANLMESELFGYDRGSFTGGLREGKKGLIEMAGNGTILLDEIGDMPIDLQVKLLHVIDNRYFTRIGSISKIEVKSRFIFATNCNLIEMVSAGKFREDLYYRISVLPLKIFPLRDRKEDIPIFIDYFLNVFNEKHRKQFKLSKDDIDFLCEYSYPGNIRELMNTVERKVIFSNIVEQSTTNLSIQSSEKADKLEQPEIVRINKIYPIKNAVEELEKQILTIAKQKYHTTREIAKVLQIDQSTVVKKMNKYFDD